MTENEINRDLLDHDQTATDIRDYTSAWLKKLYFQEDYPFAKIETVCIQIDEYMAIFKATVQSDEEDKESVYSQGHGSCTKEDFVRYIEAAETQSIGRAIQNAGYGVHANLAALEREGKIKGFYSDETILRTMMTNSFSLHDLHSYVRAIFLTSGDRISLYEDMMVASKVWLHNEESIAWRPGYWKLLVSSIGMPNDLRCILVNEINMEFKRSREENDQVIGINE